MKILGREPAFWIGLIATIIIGVVQTLAGEGVISDATQGQIGDGVNALVELFTLLSPFLAGLVIRQNVFSPATTQKIADRAKRTGNTDIGEPPSGDLG